MVDLVMSQRPGGSAVSDPQAWSHREIPGFPDRRLDLLIRWLPAITFFGGLVLGLIIGVVVS
jgi:hypothetical protein